MLHKPCTVPSSCSSLMAPCQSKLTMDSLGAALLPILRTCRRLSAKCSLSRSSSFLCSKLIFNIASLAAECLWQAADHADLSHRSICSPRDSCKVQAEGPGLGHTCMLQRRRLMQAMGKLAAEVCSVADGCEG